MSIGTDDEHVTPRSRLRLRLAEGALVLGISGASVGGLASPAAAEPISVFECTTQAEARTIVTRFSGLPANEKFYGFGFGRGSSGHSVTYQGWAVTTDATGAFTTPSVPADLGLPTYTSVAVYRDLNANFRWDPDVDDTVYKGEATFTDCPQTVTASPK